MPTNRKDNVYINSGETLRIEVIVRDSDGEEMVLYGAAAKLGIYFNGALSIRDCTIINSKVIAILTEAETSTLDGNYKYEIVLETADGEKKSLAYGIAVITPSLIGMMYGSTPFPPLIIPTSGSGITPITGWIANSGVYNYKILFPISGVVITDIVYISIEQDDLAVAQTAGFAPFCDSYAGGITFYATSIPLSPIDFTYMLVH